MVKIAPSILSADFSNLGAEVYKLEQNGADLIHIDIMDGHFVPNITFGSPIVEAIRKYTGLEFDVHLMITNPDQYIEKFIKAGSDIITIHIESSCHIYKTIDLIKSYGKKVGIAINPDTPLAMIENVLPYVDLITVMSVHPGFGGQSFIEESYEKIKQLKQTIIEKDLNILIEVDGGINLENARDVAMAGADILVSGSTIFKAQDMSDVIIKMKNCV